MEKEGKRRDPRPRPHPQHLIFAYFNIISMFVIQNLTSNNKKILKKDKKVFRLRFGIKFYFYLNNSNKIIFTPTPEKVDKKKVI